MINLSGIMGPTPASGSQSQDRTSETDPDRAQNAEAASPASQDASTGGTLAAAGTASATSNASAAVRQPAAAYSTGAIQSAFASAGENLLASPELELASARASALAAQRLYRQEALLASLAKKPADLSALLGRDEAGQEVRENAGPEVLAEVQPRLGGFGAQALALPI